MISQAHLLPVCTSSAGGGEIDTHSKVPAHRDNAGKIQKTSISSLNNILFHDPQEHIMLYILSRNVLLSHAGSAVCYTRGQMATTTGWKQTKQAPAFPHLKSVTHVTNRSNGVAKKKNYKVAALQQR